MSYRGTSAGFTVETTRCLWQRVNCSRSAAICQEKITNFFRIYSVVAAHSVRHVRAAHDCMRQQTIITPDSRLTASLSAAQNGGKVAHTVRRYGGD